VGAAVGRLVDAAVRRREICDRAARQRGQGRHAPADVRWSGELPLQRRVRGHPRAQGRALGERLLDRRLIGLLRHVVERERSLHAEPVAGLGAGVGFALGVSEELGEKEKGRDDEEDVLTLHQAADSRRGWTARRSGRGASLFYWIRATRRTTGTREP